MQAIIFGFLMPVIPLLIWKQYNKERKLSAADVATRYVSYTLIVTVLTTCAMVVMCDDNTSFLEKMDCSPAFVLKYVAIQLVAVAAIAAVEWYTSTRKVKIEVDWAGYGDNCITRFLKKWIAPMGIWLLAAVVVIMNLSLMFDNVVWGDEAYSANLVRHDIEGIFQVLTLEENHPPLYYLWLKLFVTLFGHEGYVLHMASVVPFIIGILLAVICMRKHFGNMPTALFIIISGMAAPCVEYNLEIRMYALAFLGLAGAFYCAYRIFSGSKVAAWIGMVLWGLVAAYSHYYALVVAGILIFVTCVAAVIRFGGKTWVKGVLALAGFIVAYLPWLSVLLKSTKSVSNNWWMTEILSVNETLDMIMCGANMRKVILPLFLVILLVLLIMESAIVSRRKQDNQEIIRINTPSMKGWSAETYTLAVGVLTILGTVVFAYGMCILMRPLLAVRYIYPLCAITAMILVMGSARLLVHLGDWSEKIQKPWVTGLGKAVLAVILVMLFVLGWKDYSAYKATAEYESAKTEEILYIIGDIDEDEVLVNNGVKHIGWTVLDYYYPDNEIMNTSCGNVDADSFWYFSNYSLSEDEFNYMVQQGYEIAAYGELQLGKYPLVLYHFQMMK